MMRLFLIFITLISPSLFLSVKQGKSIAKTLPVSLFAMVLILYMGGLLKIMKLTVYIEVITAIILFAMTLKIFIKSSEKKKILKEIFTPAFCLWLFFFIFLIGYHHGRMLTEWDEFTHWGDVVKVMYSINDFSTNPKSLSTFQSYLPAMSLFQYFWQVIGGKFREWFLFVSYQLFVITLFLPFLTDLKWKKKDILKILVSIVLILLTPIVFFNNQYTAIYYTSIYVDSFLAAIFGYCIASVYFSKKYEKFELLNLTLALTVLTLTKDIGIVFAAITIFIALLDILFIENKTKLSDFKPQNIKKLLIKIKPIFIFSAACLGSYILWKLNIKINHATSAFSSPINILEIINTLLGRDGTYRTIVVHNYIDSLSGTPMLNNNLTINIYGVLAIFIGITYLIWACELKNKKSKLVFSMFLLGDGLYIFLMLILYISKFSEYEALNLASFARYMAIYLQAIILVITLVIIGRSNNDRFNKCLVVVVCFAVIFTPISIITGGYFAKANSSLARTPYTEAADIIKKELKNKKARIYFIVQNSNGYEYWVLRYSAHENLSGINTSYEKWSWSLGKPYYKEDIWTKNISSNKWMNELLKNYDYVFLYKIDENFVAKYGNLFDNINEIKKNSLCKINKEKKKIICN